MWIGLSYIAAIGELPKINFNAVRDAQLKGFKRKWRRRIRNGKYISLKIFCFKE